LKQLESNRDHHHTSPTRDVNLSRSKTEQQPSLTIALITIICLCTISIAYIFYHITNHFNTDDSELLHFSLLNFPLAALQGLKDLSLTINSRITKSVIEYSDTITTPFNSDVSIHSISKFVKTHYLRQSTSYLSSPSNEDYNSVIWTTSQAIIVFYLVKKVIDFIDLVVKLKMKMGFEERQVGAEERQVGFKERQVGAEERQVGFKERQVEAEERQVGFKERQVGFEERKIALKEKNFEFKVRKHLFDFKLVSLYESVCDFR
jgi:hypothetical protein